MRNPIRLKNLRLRFAPYWAMGLVLMLWRRPSLEGAVLGLPLVVAGAVLRSWGAGHLVKNDTLTMTGPYAHLRHPLYLGTLLIGSGFALFFGGLVSIALLAGAWTWFVLHYFPRKERGESARLVALYGEAFVEYRDRVPALWPRWRAFARGEGEAGSRAARWELARYSDNNELGTLLAVMGLLLVLGLRTRWGAG